jgi:hypothetical protein
LGQRGADGDARGGQSVSGGAAGLIRLPLNVGAAFPCSPVGLNN